MNSDFQPSKLNPWVDELECAAVRCRDGYSGGSVPQAESISVASVWQLATPDAAELALRNSVDEFVYRRVDHPNARTLATKLAKMHAAERAVVTAQGMSAIVAVAMSQLKPGATVWIGEELYGETSTLFQNSLARWKVQSRVFDPCDASQVERLACETADLVVIETITNPRLRVPDIASVAQATHRAGGLLMVDNTFATHLICRPLQLGADFVIESLGKQVNGHSDGMAGLVCGVDPRRMQEVSATVKTFGLTSSPLDCYLTHRGLMSLAVRLERACANALALAQMLSRLKNVIHVDYPGLLQAPSADVVTRQFSGGFGWMLTFHVELARTGLEKLFKALQPEICFVPSLGDATTTISHPRSTSHRAISPDLLSKLGIEEGTIRVSCGLEPTNWLVERFASALDAIDCSKP